MRKAPHYCAAAAALLIALSSGSAWADAGKKPVVIRFFSDHGFAFPYQFADALGYLKEKGIEIQSMGFSQGGPENIVGVNTGSVDIGGAATPAVINAVASGAPIIGVLPNGGESKTTNSKFFVLTDSPIKTAKDLKGKTIAVNTLGAHLDYLVREYLKQHHMMSSDVQLVVVPGPQLDQVLRHKQVDVVATGTMWQTTFAGRIEGEGGVRVLFTGYDVLGPIALDANVMKKSFIEQHPQVVRDFVTASAKAADWTEAHPNQARQILAEIFKKRGDNPERAKYWTGFGVRQHNLYTFHDAQFWIDALVKQGKLKPDQVTPADIETNKYNDFAHLAQQ
jgi:ABC-type nitrate/sulfonate/bicarbonate transport system substrate-binding protein